MCKALFAVLIVLSICGNATPSSAASANKSYLTDVALVVPTPQQVMAQANGPMAFLPPLDLAGYHLTFDDEFDQMNIVADGQRGRWYAPVHSNFGQAKFLPPSQSGPFFVSNGVLTIRAHKENGQWISGLMQSVDSHGQGFAQQYGYFEMRAKFPAGAATWPGFWLLTLNGITDKTKTVGEIDVVEQYGDDPARFYMSLKFLASAWRALVCLQTGLCRRHD